MRSAFLALALVVAGAVLAPLPRSRAATRTPALAQLVGQRLVVAMQGSTASAVLLARIRAGQVGGVILFGANIRNAPQVRALAASLQRAASAGGQPPVFVMADQEGGSVRRLRWAPPVRSAAELGRLAPAAVRAAGRATAGALRDVGINVDLAPVADVPSVPGSFIAAQSRGFSSGAARVATLATAFASGLADGGAIATAKHFPGLGRAAVSTDVAAVTIDASRSELESDLLPYRQLIAAGVPLVMLSNASYTALDGKPAAWSPAAQSLLRTTLGYTGVTVTDALEAVAKTQRRPVVSAAVLSAQAGTDLLLVTGAQSDAVFRHLLEAAEAGRVSRASLRRSYTRIVALKRALR